MKALWLVYIAVLVVAMGSVASPHSNGLFPKPISSHLPTYPEPARAARVAGAVRLWFLVDAKGEVDRAEVISGNTMLRDAAAATVKSWRFRPGSIRPNVRCETEFVYVLNVQSKKGEPKLTVSMADFRRVEVVSEFYVEAVE